MYRDILEEWDDKMSDDLLIEDSNLHPDEWVDGSLNEMNKHQIKTIIEKSFLQTTHFVESIFEKFLLMYWQDLRIDYQLFISDQLADPVDSIQYSLEHLAFQKKCFTEELPFIMDKQLLRVNSRKLRQKIQNYPG